MTPFNPDDIPPCPDCGHALTVTSDEDDEGHYWGAECNQCRWCDDGISQRPTWRHFAAVNHQIRALLAALGVS